MGLFRRKQPAAPAGEDHAVIVHFGLSDDEFGEGEAVLYLYGPDHEQLWQSVEPEVRACALRPASALVRPGGPDVAARRVDL